MKNLIDKYQEQILDLGVGYFDLSGQTNNDRIILNLYKSEFKNGLSVNVVMNLNSQEISTFGKGGFDLNVKKIINDKLVLCDGTEYEFIENKINGLGIEREQIDDGYKLSYKNASQQEIYYSNGSEFLLTYVQNKYTNEDVFTYQYNNALQHVFNNIVRVNENDGETDLSEDVYYLYNTNGTCREINIRKGNILLKKIKFEYSGNYISRIKCFVYQQEVEKLLYDYSISRTMLNRKFTFMDNLTSLSKSVSYSLDNVLTITDEFGIVTNIEDGVVTPYYNKITDELEREKIRVKYHFDSNNRVCDIEGYNKIHLIRKYQDNKLLLRCDGCFKDVRYLGNVVPYYNYILTGTIDKIVTDNNVNFINGLGNDSLYQIDLRSTSMIELEYKNCCKKSYSGVFITDDLHYSNFKICISYRLMDGSSKVEEYSINNNIFAVPIVLPNNCEDFVLSLLGEQNSNNVITFNLFVIDNAIVDVYFYDDNGTLLEYIERGIKKENIKYNDSNFNFSGNVFSITNKGKMNGKYTKNLLHSE